MTVLRFSTRQFPLSDEMKPSVNPIYGHALGEMLRQEFQTLGHEVDNCVEEEDWGWYFFTSIEDQPYMIGTIAYRDIDPETEEPVSTSDPIEHAIQFDKKRSFKQIILGRNKFTDDDPIFKITEAILERKILDMTDFSKGL